MLTFPRASCSVWPTTFPVSRFCTWATGTRPPLLENSVKKIEYGVPAGSWATAVKYHHSIDAAGWP